MKIPCLRVSPMCCTAVLAMMLCGCRTPLPAKAPTRPQHITTGRSGGWPPRPSEAMNLQLVPWTEIEGSLTDAREAQLRAAALGAQEVRDALGTRSAYITASEVELPKGRRIPPPQRRRTRLTFFSHTHNAAVQVEMIGAKVARVNRLPELRPHEGVAEVEEAIALARRDDRIPDAARALESTAILAYPDQDRAVYKNRVLYVAFSNPQDRGPRFVALVDLTSNRVLSAGPAPKN